MDIGERLRLVRGKESRDTFAQKIGIHSQSLYRYEQGGRNVDSSIVAAVCDLYGVSTDWLIFGRGPMRICENANHCDDDPRQYDCTDSANLMVIPRVEARLCATTGLLQAPNTATEMYAFKAAWIRQKGNAAHMVLMDVTGDSMAPEIKHGDMVLIDQSKTDIYGYGYYAVGVEGAIYIKEIMTAPGVLILKSINPRYSDISVSVGDDRTANIHIVGRVLWVGRDLG